MVRFTYFGNPEWQLIWRGKRHLLSPHLNARLNPGQQDILKNVICYRQTSQQSPDRSPRPQDSTLSAFLLDYLLIIFTEMHSHAMNQVKIFHLLALHLNQSIILQSLFLAIIPVYKQLFMFVFFKNWVIAPKQLGGGVEEGLPSPRRPALLWSPLGARQAQNVGAQKSRDVFTQPSSAISC